MSPSHLRNAGLVVLALVAVAAVLALSAASPMIRFAWNMLISYFRVLLLFGTICILTGAGLFVYLTRHRRILRQQKLTMRDIERRLR